MLYFVVLLTHIYTRCSTFIVNSKRSKLNPVYQNFQHRSYRRMKTRRNNGGYLLGTSISNFSRLEERHSRSSVQCRRRTCLFCEVRFVLNKWSAERYCWLSEEVFARFGRRNYCIGFRSYPSCARLLAYSRCHQCKLDYTWTLLSLRIASFGG